MAVSDDKQQRLSTLSQDVIAVPKKPAGPASGHAGERERGPDRVPEPPAPERKSVPPTQDVFRVAPSQDVFKVTPTPDAPVAPQPTSAGPVVPPVRAKPRVTPAPQPSRGALTPVQLGTAVVAVVALLLAVFSVTRDAGPAAPADSVEIAQLKQELTASNERVAKLEMALSAAASDAQKLGTPGQANVLQISAGMRQLRNDIDVVSNDLARISTEIGELRTLAGSGSGQSKLAMAQVEQLAARFATLKEQVASAPRASAPAAAGGAVSADIQAQLKTLSARTEKMGADIRQLYRLAGGQ